MIDVDRLREGDRQEFRAAVHQYKSLVMHVARSFAADQDEADDLFQAIWIQIYKKISLYDGAGSLEGWIHRVASNICVSHHRSEKSRSERRDKLERTSDIDARNPFPDPLEHTEREERHALLHRALAMLPERQHQAIMLRVLEGHTPEETADIMGISPATVRSNIRHGITRLREIMEETGEELPHHRPAN